MSKQGKKEIENLKKTLFCLNEIWYYYKEVYGG